MIVVSEDSCWKVKDPSKARPRLVDPKDLIKIDDELYRLNSNAQSNFRTEECGE